jgi:hypothetical protein
MFEPITAHHASDAATAPQTKSLSSCQLNRHQKFSIELPRKSPTDGLK